MEPNKLLDQFFDWNEARIRASGQMQRDLLELRRAGLNGLAGLISAQSCAFGADAPEALPAPKAAVWAERAMLEEFATGSVARALGPEFAIYEGRRSPRIPNGDLLLMDRVLSVDGRRSDFSSPAAIEVEYDVPAGAWFFGPGSNGQLPYSVLLEIALQPCGLLSAILGTQLQLPEVDFFFRNLDGQAMLLNRIDARGRTVRTHARLLDTVVSGTTIIQRFTFALSVDGLPLFEGSSAFGYFPPEQMAAQAGLDGGSASRPAPRMEISRRDVTAANRSEQMKFLDGLSLDLRESRVAGVYRNDPLDWFYACHFFQDPVMPGSLGVEAMLQALEALAVEKAGGNGRVELAPGRALTWKYRGQVLPSAREVAVEARLRPSEPNAPHTYIADADLWVDGLRIYEVKGLAVEVFPLLSRERAG